MNSEDAYWDELGVAWRAVDPNLEGVSSLLQARLRRQSLAIAGALVIGVPLCGAGLVLGAVTAWHGWTTGTWNFVTRGIAIELIALLLLRALVLFLPVGRRSNNQPLSDMLAIASARMRRTSILIRAAMIACGIAAVFGIIGTAIRVRAGSAPHLSPIVDLIIIALTILCLWLYGRRVTAEARKLHYLLRNLGPSR